MTAIPVKTTLREYQVHVGEGLIDEPMKYLNTIGRRAFIITNWMVGRLHLQRFNFALKMGGVDTEPYVVKEGEHHKTMSTVMDICDFLMTKRARRSDTIIALGGGVIGDISGFAASIFKRGMKFVQVPTTLLAQVDAAVGGKTGVNHPDGKNMLGTFHQPESVLVDVGVLSTLEDRDFRAGMAEVIKYALTMDPELFTILRESHDAIIDRDPAILATVVERCIRNKAEVVERDEFETLGIREVLNFGHTIGHAVETVSDHRYLHGEAVAIGMAEEARTAFERGFLKGDQLGMLLELISDYGLQVDLPRDMNPTTLRDIIVQDKKVKGGTITMPVLSGLGEVEMRTVRVDDIY